jgi:hypothetical protein
MDGNTWQLIMKNSMESYIKFKRENPHFWIEAQQLTGNGEVAALDSIILNYIEKHKEHPDLMGQLTRLAEGHIFKDY